VKLRFLTSALALVLAVTGLSACTTKVGLAATINGKRVTDSDLVSYLTPNAKVSEKDASGTAITRPVRSFVLNILIEDRLFALIASRLPKPGLSEKQIQADIAKQVAGTSKKELAAQVAGITGFKSKFYDLFAHAYILNEIFGQINQQAPAILNEALKGLKFPVTVSAAYGTWDPKTYQLKSGPTDGYPAYMKFPASATPGN